MLFLYLYTDKAYALIQLDNFTGAIQTIDQGLERYKNDEMLWYNKGFALFRLGNYQDALNAYDKVLQINNQSVPAFNNRGDTLFQMGRYQDAVDSYLRANAIEPGNSYATAGLEKAQEALATQHSQLSPNPRHGHPSYPTTRTVPPSLPTMTQRTHVSPLSPYPAGKDQTSRRITVHSREKTITNHLTFFLPEERSSDVDKFRPLRPEFPSGQITTQST